MSVVSRRLEREVLEQKGKICRICGKKCHHSSPGSIKRRVELTLHHIIPRSLGGPDTVENLEPVHRRCHDAIHNIRPKRRR